MKFISLKSKILNAINKSEAAADESRKNAADIEYIAMMCDVDLGNDSKEEVEDETQ